jgi:hypothetical protein
VLDPVLLEGDWGWELEPSGKLTFVPDKKRKKAKKLARKARA